MLLTAFFVCFGPVAFNHVIFTPYSSDNSRLICSIYICICLMWTWLYVVDIQILVQCVCILYVSWIYCCCVSFEFLWMLCILHLSKVSSKFCVSLYHVRWSSTWSNLEMIKLIGIVDRLSRWRGVTNYKKINSQLRWEKFLTLSGGNIYISTFRKKKNVVEVKLLKQLKH